MTDQPKPKISTLPYINVQHDYVQVIQDVSQSIVKSEDFWISGYKDGEESVHGKISCSRDEDGDLVMKAKDGIVLHRAGEDDASFSVSIPSLSIPQTPILKALQTIRPSSSTASAVPKRLNTFDVSSSRPQLVLGGDDGDLRLYEYAGQGSGTSRKLKGCVGDCLETRHFPSGEVAITSTLSTPLLIHSASSPSSFSPASLLPAQTLTPSPRPSTSLAFVARGKRILTASKDRTLKLVSVADNTVLSSLHFEDEVWSVCWEGEGLDEKDGKSGRGWVGLKNGEVWEVQLESEELKMGERVGASGNEGEGSVKAIACSDIHNLLAFGSSSGLLSIYSTSSATAPILLAQIRRSPGAINSLVFLPDDAKLLIGGEDGMPWLCSQGKGDSSPESPGGGWGVEAELAGFEEGIERVRAVRRGERLEIWVGGREGVARF